MTDHRLPADRSRGAVIADPAELAAEVRTIDMTPTWAGITPGLLAIVTNGETVEARKTAESEIGRMARLADLYVAERRTPEGASFIRPGTRLPNGALVIDGRATDRGEGVVLALTMGLAAHPFVTWRVNLTTGDAYSGDYCLTFEGAIRSYGARTGFVPEALGNGVDIDDQPEPLSGDETRWAFD